MVLQLEMLTVQSRVWMQAHTNKLSECCPPAVIAPSRDCWLLVQLKRKSQTKNPTPDSGRGPVSKEWVRVINKDTQNLLLVSDICIHLHINMYIHSQRHTYTEIACQAQIHIKLLGSRMRMGLLFIIIFEFYP